MASDNRVKASAVLKNLTLDGQMDWTVEKFIATLKVRKELLSPDFKFYLLPSDHRGEYEMIQAVDSLSHCFVLYRNFFWSSF